MTTHQQLTGFVWQVADLLRGDFKQSEYGKVILPFTVLRRLDCVLARTKPAVLERKVKLESSGIQNMESLRSVAGTRFFNTSKLDLAAVAADHDEQRVAKNLTSYLAAFSSNARDVFESYDFATVIARLENAKLLYQVVGKFASLDLGPERVGNQQMGYVFEELIRRFSELSNETAGEHFTPREVVRLMVNLLLAPDTDQLRVPGKVFQILDPACGTGGMLTAAEERIYEYNPDAHVGLYGQELNPESYAICRSDMMIRGENAENIRFGNSFSDDKHYRAHFDYLLANPPFGVEWKKVKEEVESEHEKLGWAGRFGAGLPRINDGSLLFLQHMVAHMKRPEEGGGRMAIVFNGSPLFSGAAGSGESEIRRWILENDLLEGIVALPEQLFYNTGIATYFWILTNRKTPEHQGKVVLVDGREHWAKMRKSLGDKRRYVTDEQIEELTSLYSRASAVAADPNDPSHAKVKVFATSDFGYKRITVERPLVQRFELTEENLAEFGATKPLTKYDGRDWLLDVLRPLTGAPASYSRNEFARRLRESLGSTPPSTIPAAVRNALWKAVSVSDPEGQRQVDADGNALPDSDLRDNENVPLDEDIDEYMAREVLRYVPDAWVDHSKTRTGYEIPFTRYFYEYTPPRSLEEIDDELKAIEREVERILAEVTG